MTVPIERLHSALSDRYTIERELGAGGMATGYPAHDLEHHRMGALKVLKPDFAWTRRISNGGGVSPRWSPMGDELLYWQGTALVSHAGRGYAPQEFGPARILFSGSDNPPAAFHFWDVGREGRRFLVVVDNPDAPAWEIHVDTDWFGTLNRAAGGS